MNKEEKLEKKKMSTVKKVILSVLLVLILAIVSFIIYEVATVNNTYYIGEKNLQIPVFVYHDIVEDESQIEYDYMQTTTDTFKSQIEGLIKEGYHYICYNDLVQYKEGNKKLYKKSCVLTFDDGYKDVYENAYPIIKDLNIPLTMFVITDYMGTDDYMTWEEAKDIQQSGLGLISSHSLQHNDFSKLSVEETVQNVNDSYKAIEENLGSQILKVFTYPCGIYNEEQLSALENQGYIINLTDNKINKSKSLNLYGLHRCYPLSDSLFKMNLKIIYRSIRY